MPVVRDRIRFLHCADIHLDAPFGGRGCREYAEMRRKDVWKTFESAVGLAEEEQVDFILICGDLSSMIMPQKPPFKGSAAFLADYPFPS